MLRFGSLGTEEEVVCVVGVCSWVFVLFLSYL